jgi:hypothetical protein
MPEAPWGIRSMRTVSEDVYVQLRGVGCLDLVVDSIQHRHEPLLGGGVQHLRPDAGNRG